MCLQIIFGIKYQRLFVFTHIFWLATVLALQATMLGPCQSEIHTPTGMKHREEELQCLAAKHSTKHLELPISIAQSIAMCQVELLAIDFTSHRLAVDDDSTFLFQIVTTPNVVIANEEMYFHAQVGEFGNLAEETCVTLRHYQLELIPEIKHIAQQIDSTRLVLDAVKEVHQSAFLRTAMFYGTRP